MLCNLGTRNWENTLHRILDKLEGTLTEAFKSLLFNGQLNFQYALSLECIVVGTLKVEDGLPRIFTVF